ncbi:hypothetical protein KJ865_09865, partial [Myxococcota bacterium]|nr:hypothetical protein [Myxococcota bacterium]
MRTPIPLLLWLCLSLASCKSSGSDSSNQNNTNNANNANNTNNVNNSNNINNINNSNNTTAHAFAETSATDNDPYLGGVPDVVTSHLLPGHRLTITGSLDAQTTQDVGYSDSDGYRITVDATMNLTGRISWSPDSNTIVSLTLLAADKKPLSTFMTSMAGAIVLWPVVAPPGEYIVHVSGKGNSLQLAYSVEISESAQACEIVSQSAAFTEVETAANSTTNDTIHVSMPGFPQVSAATGTAAESTGITLEADQNSSVSGTLTPRSDSPDQFLDRDTFVIQTGATSGHVWIRVDAVTPSAEELDCFVHDGDMTLLGAAYT